MRLCLVLLSIFGVTIFATEAHSAQPNSVPQANRTQQTKKVQQVKKVTNVQYSNNNQEKETVPFAVGPNGKLLYETRAKTSSEPQKLKLPTSDTSLWFRYYQAGEDASITHHDADLAKKYWLAALAELEKNPPKKGADLFLSVRLSALDKGLIDSYPADWSKQPGDTESVLNQRKEQVETLLRIARINERYTKPSDLFRIKSNERYTEAKSAYDKAVADAALKASKTEAATQ